MLQYLRIEKEDLQALLSEMERCGFVATTLHEIRTFTMVQRRTKHALDGACACREPNIRWKESSGWYCSVCYKSPRKLLVKHGGR